MGVFSGFSWPPAGILVWLAALAVCAIVLTAGSYRRGSRAPYRRGRFMTANEKSFLAALDAAIGPGFRVFAQVRLAELVEVERGASAERSRRAMNKMFGKSVDFIICSAGNLEPVAAIEVDDRSHFRLDRKERDEFVNGVFAEIGLPLVRVPARMRYGAAEIHKMLGSAGIGLCVSAETFGGRQGR